MILKLKFIGNSHHGKDWLLLGNSIGSPEKLSEKE